MLLAGAFGAAVLIELAVLAAARRFELLATPNERSLHSEPTPAIGGLAVVLPVSAWLAVVGLDGFEPALGLLAAGLLLAGIGLWDDVRELSAVFRFACHVVAVVVVLRAFDVEWPLVLLLAAGFAFVWQVNLFNFMDGIDGIAGMQVLIYCVGVQLLAGGIPGWLGDLVWVVAGACVGFLAFNWPPARIFMGDVGSGFLGLLLGALAVALDQAGVVPLVGSLLLLGFFWFDASYALCVRMLTGQNFVRGHRSHLYQKLAAEKGHRWTTVAYSAFACLWLLPLAAASQHFPGYVLLWLLLAFAPLAIAARRWRAGLPADGHE